MLRRWLVLAGVLVVMLAVGHVYGEDENPVQGKKGKGKGKGNLAEMIFKRLDTNGDGKLSPEEFKKFGERSEKLKERPDMSDRMFKRLDTNGDGFISYDEFKTGMEKMKDAKGKFGGKGPGKKPGDNPPPKPDEKEPDDN